MPQQNTSVVAACVIIKSRRKTFFPCKNPSYLYIACQWNLNEFFFFFNSSFHLISTSLECLKAFFIYISFRKHIHILPFRNIIRQGNQCQYPVFHLSLPPLKLLFNLYCLPWCLFDAFTGCYHIFTYFF